MIDNYQQIAVEQSRLHIPILFAFDTIHGFRTIFPIPLGDRLELRSRRRVDRSHDRRLRVGRGRHQADLQPDGRRLARAALGPHLRGRGRGPVPELGDGRRARAAARRATTTARPTRRVTSVKHFVAYGQPESGRDYNTTDMSSSGCGTSTCRRSRPRSTRARTRSMCSFNAINGVPGCANAYTETDILKDAVGLRRLHRERLHRGRRAARLPAGVNPDSGPCGHGVAADGPEAAAAALNAGTDSEMVSTNYRDFGKELVASRQVSMQAHRRRRAPHPAHQVPRRALRASATSTSPTRRARRCSRSQPRRRALGRRRSMVLLKNDGATSCRSSAAKKTAVIGPLGDSPHDMLGPWWGRGDDAGRRVARSPV